MKSTIRKHSALTFVMALVACSSTNTLGPENSLQLVNEPGTFEWQVTALDKVSQTLTYTWTNNGDVANVNQSPGLNSGTASIRITDASGVEVYSRNLGEGGTFQTSTGTPGGWTVTVTMNEATGSINFRLETP